MKCKKRKLGHTTRASKQHVHGYIDKKPNDWSILHIREEYMIKYRLHLGANKTEY
jgi:hypothetical protein